MAKKLTDGAQEQGGTVVPSFATKTHAHADPWIPATPMFIYKMHPARWGVIGGQLLPQLGTAVMRDGCDNVSIGKDGQIRFARAKAKLDEGGWITVPYEWAPDGHSYVKAVDTRPEGASVDSQTAYISVFEDAFAGDRATYPRLDEYVEWVSGLVSSGKLPACPPQKVRKMLEQAQVALAKAEAQRESSGGAGIAQTCKALAANVEVLEAAMESTPKRKAPAKKGALPTVEV